MKKFEHFRLEPALADESRRRHKSPLEFLKGSMGKTPNIRAGLVEQIYDRVKNGESLHVTGYPGAGKSTVLQNVLQTSYREEPAGLGITVHHNFAGAHVDNEEVMAAWALIEGGYKPRFLAIDDATELVHDLEDRLSPSSTISGLRSGPNLILDMLAKLPDSIPLLLSFPMIHTTYDDYRRESAVDFFGKASRITIPSFLPLEDFEHLLDFNFRPAIGVKALQELRERGLYDILANHVGLYEGNISTLLFRALLRPPRLYDLSYKSNIGNVAAAIKEEDLLLDFARASKTGVTIEQSHVRAALEVFDRNAKVAERTHLEEHGIILDGKFMGPGTLTYRAFKEAARF